MCLFPHLASSNLSEFCLLTAAAAASSLQSCLTLCDPIDSSPPGSPIPGILQARTLEWVAISFSTAWKWKVKVKSPSRVWLLATPWTAAYQVPLSMGPPGKNTGVGCHCLLWPANYSYFKNLTLRMEELLFTLLLWVHNTCHFLSIFFIEFLANLFGLD